MPGWIDVTTNDQLFHQEDSWIREIIKLLDLQYVCSAVSPSVAPPQQVSFDPSGHSMLKLACPILPHPLGFPSWDGQLSLVCVTSMSRRIFWDYVAEALGLDSEAMPRPDNDEVALKLSDIGGLSWIPPHVNTLRLLYTRQRWSTLDESLLLKYSGKSRQDRPRAKAYDSQSISETVSSLADRAALSESASPDEHSIGNSHDPPLRQKFLEVFRSSYLLLRHWACCMGISGGQFDLLTDELLLHMYVGALDRLKDADRPHLDVASFIQAVMRSNFFQHPLVMPSRYGPGIAVQYPSNASPEPTSPEGGISIGNARTTVDFGKVPVEQWAQAARKAFIDNHECFIRVDSRCWVPKMRRDFSDVMPEILLKLQKHFQNGERRVLVQIWPYSVSAPEEREEGENMYVLGVYRFNERLAADADYVGERCESYVRKLRYDENSASLDCRITSPEEVKLLLPNSNAAQEIMLSTPNAAQTTHAMEDSSIESGKFRTASAAMDRLRWDPKHAALDYEVGYVDRFETDLMWKSLDRWEKMTEEEEFIPEHRIQKIRKKPEGVVVWDREKRFDGTGG